MASRTYQKSLSKSLLNGTKKTCCYKGIALGYVAPSDINKITKVKKQPKKTSK